MTLSNFEEFAFRLLSFYNYFLWPFPLKWDYPNSKLLCNAFCLKLLPFYLVMAYIWFFGWTCFFTTIYLTLQKRENFPRINASLLILIWAIFVAITLVVYVGFKNVKAVLSAFNEFLVISDETDEGKLNV